MAGLSPGDRLEVRGKDPHLGVHLGAWARARGHGVEGPALVRGPAGDARWRHAERAGAPEAEGVVGRPPAAWGLAARGALVEAGGPDLATADLDDKDVVWADLAPRLYAQAAAS